MSVCGKLYPGVKTEVFVETWNPNTYEWDRVSSSKTAYSIDQVDRYKEDYKDLFSLRYKRFFSDKETHPYKSTDEIHEKLRCPLLMFVNSQSRFNPNPQILLNPKLNDFDFQQIMNPLEIFQVIEMWFNNLTSVEKPIPQVSNNDMIEAKGFDLKHSFRKDKAKKKG